MRSARLAGPGVAVVLLLAAAGAEEAPLPPVRPKTEKAAHELWGRVVLSDGQEHAGLVSTTPGKPIRIFDRKKSTYRDIAFDKIARIEPAPEREWSEREWRWLEGGNDEKVCTDRFYRAAEYRTELVLQGGERFTGDVVAPICIRVGDKRHAFELRKRAKSSEPAPREELKPLLYIKEVILTDRETAPAQQLPGQGRPAGQTVMQSYSPMGLSSFSTTVR